MKLRFAILAVAGACTALTAQPTCAQKLYKHVDEKGVVTYTDLPDKPKDKPMTVDNTKPNGDRTEKQNDSELRFRQKMQGRGTQTVRETPPASTVRDSSKQ